MRETRLALDSTHQQNRTHAHLDNGGLGVVKIVDDSVRDDQQNRVLLIFLADWWGTRKNISTALERKGMK